MSLLDSPAEPSAVAAPSRIIPSAVAFFAGAVFLGAFLLFQVQPLISKFILPWFGGTPAVWTTCMLFFQVLLFAGYAYAHLSERLLGATAQAQLHLVLLVAALALLPIIPDASWKPTGDLDPTVRILALLAASVGFPYFVLSATGPLLQAWFCRVFPGRSPYRLYSLSNIGSLAALISYPFIVEPAMSAPQQASAWSGAFVVFALVCGSCAACVWRLRKVIGGAEHDLAATFVDSSWAGLWMRRGVWLSLPACASLTLLATTNYVCQDVAVIPFLWIAPLSLYLLSFIVAFDHQRWYVRRAFSAATMLLWLAVAGVSPLMHWLEEFGYTIPYIPDLLLNLVALFAACMVCHGELVRQRPGPRHLTEFYLLIAAGGALGGIFVSLIAPHAFTTFLEWDIAFVACYLIGLTVWIVTAVRGARRGSRSVVTAAVALVGLYAVMSWDAGNDEQPIARARNFYGIVSVWSDDEPWYPAPCRVMLSGHITHGRQFVDPSQRNTPLSYYGRGTGIARAAQFVGVDPQSRYGIIGLGVGTIAAFAQPGQSVRFYEINPDVLRFANEYFWFLSDCRGPAAVILGDGRLSMEREPPQRFDLFVLDAFTGDAVPVHLLTREAMDVYLRHLADDGIIAFNITNTFLNLEPVVRGLAEHASMRWTRIFTPENLETLANRADWMLVTRNQKFLAENPSHLPPDAPTEGGALQWTDHQSNLFEILK